MPAGNKGLGSSLNKVWFNDGAKNYQVSKDKAEQFKKENPHMFQGMAPRNISPHTRMRNKMPVEESSPKEFNYEEYAAEQGDAPNWVEADKVDEIKKKKAQVAKAPVLTPKAEEEIKEDTSLIEIPREAIFSGKLVEDLRKMQKKLYFVNGVVRVRKTAVGGGSSDSNQSRLVWASDIDEAMAKFSRYFVNFSNETEVISVLSMLASEAIE